MIFTKVLAEIHLRNGVTKSSVCCWQDICGGFSGVFVIFVEVRKNVNYGRRVQNPAVECVLDSARCVLLKLILTEIIDEEVYSLRFYYLENKYKVKVEHMGIMGVQQVRR